MPGINEMSGFGRFRRIVWLSTISIAPSIALLVSASIRVAKRPAIELPSTSFSHQPLMLYATCSAVSSSPLVHLTPLRTFSVYCVASSLISQLSRSCGWNVPSFSYVTRYSSQPREKFAICDQSYVRGSLNARTSIWMRTVPPVLWPPAIAGRAAPIIEYAVAAVAPNALASARNSRRLTASLPTLAAESTIVEGSGFPVLVKNFMIFLSVVGSLFGAIPLSF